MLNALRKSAKSWVMKVILGLLALTFVAFFGGVGGGGGGRHGGQTGGGNVNAIVTVGDQNIDANAISTAFNREIRAAATLFGGNLTVEQAQQIGLLDQAINRLVAQSLLIQSASELGVSVSDAAVAQAIQAAPQFQSQSGAFDAATYEAFLLHNGISEARFVDDIRQDLARQQVLGTVAEASAAPFTLVDAIYNYREERRVIESVKIGALDLPDLAEPTEEQLTSYYETAKDNFLAPEYRTLRIASLTPQQYAEQIGVSEDDIRDAYELRRDQLSVPEQREVEQILFFDRETAERAAGLLNEGQDFAAVSQELTGGEPISLGQVVIGDLPDELAEPVFALATGAVSEPLESPFGWHLVRIIDVFEGGTPSLEEVRDEIERDLALSQARNEIFEVMDDVIDAFAGGASFDEAASDNGLQTQTIAAVSRNGLDTTDTPVAGLEPNGELLQTAFTLPAGSESDIIETDDGGFQVVRVESVTPPAPRPFADVRDGVAEAWLADQVREQAQVKANELVDRVARGESLTDAADALGLAATISEPVSRTGEGDDTLSPILVDLMFQGDVDDISVSPTADGVTVGRVVEIQSATSATGLVSLRNNLTQAVAQDIQAQLTAALQSEYSVDIDQDALERLFR